MVLINYGKLSQVRMAGTREEFERGLEEALSEALNKYTQQSRCVPNTVLFSYHPAIEIRFKTFFFVPVNDLDLADTGKINCPRLRSS